MSSRPNPKAFMYLAVGAIVAGGAACFFEYTKLGSANDNVAKLRTQVSDPKEVQKKLDDSNMKLEGAKQSLAHLEVNVSSAAYVPSMLRDLDSFGRQNGITVTGVKPTPKHSDNPAADAKKPYDELVIQVTGNGSFDAIKSFVENLSKFPKVVATHMISIEPVRTSGPDTPKGLLAMTVELKAYVFKQDADTKGVAATTPTGSAGTPAKPGTASTTAPTSGAGATPGTPAKGSEAPAGAQPAPASPAPAHPGDRKTASLSARRVRSEG